MRGAAPVLHCPRCQTPAVPGPTFVTCTECGLVFDAGAGGREVARRRTPTRDRPPPDEIGLLRVESKNDRLVLSWPVARLLGVFCLLVCTPCIYGMYLAVRAAWPIVVILAPILALLLYPTLALLLDRSYVIADATSITTKDRPLPLGPKIVCPRAGLEQIYVELIPAGMRRPQRYAVTACYGGPRPDRRGDRAIAYTRNLALARELEQRLEAHLGIPDRAERREVPLDED